MFGYVTEEQFAKLRERWEKTDVSTLDSRIIPTVIKVAEHPDLVPLWSCSGHSGVEQEKKRPDKKTVTMFQSRYIYFSVRKGHTKIFENFDKYIENIKWDDYIKIRPEMRIFLLNYGFADQEKDSSLVNVWSIAIRFRLHSNPSQGEYAIIPEQVENLWGELINRLMD